MSETEKDEAVYVPPLSKGTRVRALEGNELIAAGTLGTITWTHPVEELPYRVVWDGHEIKPGEFYLGMSDIGWLTRAHEIEEAPLHEVLFSLVTDHASVRFRCNAPEGAQCRLTCPEHCEAWTYEGHEHVLTDSGECMLLPWLADLDWYDTLAAYTGEEHPLVSGAVDLKFVEEYVEWRYSDDAAIRGASDV